MTRKKDLDCTLISRDRRSRRLRHRSPLLGTNLIRHLWRACAAAHGGKDVGDCVWVEDRRDGLEPAQAAIRAGAHVCVLDPAEQVGPAQAHTLARKNLHKKRGFYSFTFCACGLNIIKIK